MRGGGSKAVCNFSENSSVLVPPPVPYSEMPSKVPNFKSWIGSTDVAEPKEIAFSNCCPIMPYPTSLSKMVRSVKTLTLTLVETA